MKKLLLLSVFLILGVLLFAACGGGEETSGDSADSEGTFAPVSSYADTSAAPETEDPAKLLAENPYAEAGLELVLSTCEKYYNLRSHRLRTSLTNESDVTVWGLASYIEMLAEAYRLYPENADIKKYYEDVLDRCLPQYAVTDATITPPSGEVYTGIMYYNAGIHWQGDFYYDDNAWICIQLFNAYRLLGEDKYLNYAEKILEFMWTGWDDAAGGGVYWDKTFQGKGTCCNGPVCVAFLEGYRITKNETYLDRAKMIYEWCNEVLRDEKGLYSEGINSLTDLTKKPWRAAYDQGTMMTSASLLYEITGDKAYYKDLGQTSGATLGLMFRTEGDRVTMAGNPIFKAWCVGWLLRGIMMVHEAGNTATPKVFMYRMEKVLDDTLATKDQNGQYDPYFCSGEWWDGDEFDSDILQPTGVATVLLLTACYDVYQAGK